MIVSARCGLRKPDPAIYHYAAEQLGVAVERCASIADNLDRDMTGALAAKIGQTTLYMSKEKYEKKKDSITDANRPDEFIDDFIQLLDMFPDRNAK